MLMPFSPCAQAVKLCCPTNDLCTQRLSKYPDKMGYGGKGGKGWNNWNDGYGGSSWGGNRWNGQNGGKGGAENGGTTIIIPPAQRRRGRSPSGGSDDRDMAWVEEGFYPREGKRHKEKRKSSKK